MSDRDLLNDIFKKVDSKKATESATPATKPKSKRGMKKLSEYEGEERERKEQQLRKMREHAVAVNKARAEVRAEAMREKNPELYEARRRAKMALQKQKEEAEKPKPVEEKKKEEIANVPPETSKTEQSRPASESIPETKVIPKPETQDPIPAIPVPNPAKLVSLPVPAVPPPKPKPIVYDLFRKTGSLW